MTDYKQLAEAQARLSRCHRRRVGAVIVHPRRPSRTRCGGAVHHVLSYSAPIHSSSICPRCIKFQESNR